MFSMTTRVRCGASVVALTFLAWVGLAGDASAGLINSSPPTITHEIEGIEGKWTYAPSLNSFSDVPDGNEGDLMLDTRPMNVSIHGGAATVSVDLLEFNPDPFVLNNVILTNNTAADQVHSVFVGLPVGAFPGPNLVSGNVSVTVIDGGGAAGAVVASIPGFPIYQAVVDLLPVVASLQVHPFSVVAAPAANANAAASFGPLVSAIPVTGNMGIQLRFTLSPGDTASVLSRFDLVPVPEPATCTLCGLLMAVAARWARRR